MKVIVLGASGMVGQGVLRECLEDPGVEQVLAVGRSSIGSTHPKLRELVKPDLHQWSAADPIDSYDACFFCLGVSSAGMREADYHRVTYELTLAVANALKSRNPKMTFIYVSGEGTDSSEQGRTMWARVKGKTENALLGLGFARAFMFRPGYIQPLGGIRSRTTAYRIVYGVMGPLYGVWKRLFPKMVTDTRRIGRAMIRVARDGYPKPILRTPDINALADG